MEIEEFYPIIDKEAQKHNIPGMEWQDIAQEVKTRLWLKFELYDASKSSLKTWANKVMRNCIRNLIRDSKNSKQYLNRAISIDELQEEGYDVGPGGIYKPEE